jgi:predicted nucleic acid-binding protein
VRNCLLDSSFVIDLLEEIAEAREGHAVTWLRSNAKSRLWISPVTVAEVLEGAENPRAVKVYLARYSWQGIHRMHAEKVALRQRRIANRMGENDAWQVAVAECMDAVIVGHDPRAFERLASRYDDHRRSERAR